MIAALPAIGVRNGFLSETRGLRDLRSASDHRRQSFQLRHEYPPLIPMNLPNATRFHSHHERSRDTDHALGCNHAISMEPIGARRCAAPLIADHRRGPLRRDPHLNYLSPDHPGWHLGLCRADRPGDGPTPTSWLGCHAVTGSRPRRRRGVRDPADVIGTARGSRARSCVRSRIRRELALLPLALGYESIWVVLLPVQFVELLFPARRDEPWLGKRGLIISATVFVLASFVAWYSWTQLYLPSLPSHSDYKVPLSSVLIALTAIVLLTAAALGPKRSSRTDTAKTGTVPPPILVGLAAFGLAVPWFALIFLAYGSMPTLPVAVPMIGGLALAGFAFVLIARWSRSPAWSDSSRLALIFGATLASMLAGFRIFAVGGGAPHRRHRQTRFECHRGRVADPPRLETLAMARACQSTTENVEGSEVCR